MRWHGPATSAPAATYSANAPRDSILLYDCGQSYILIELVRYAEPSVSNGILPLSTCARVRETTSRSIKIFVELFSWRKKTIEYVYIKSTITVVV